MPSRMMFDARRNAYRCMNCRMYSPDPVPQCPFCNAIISNYEELEMEVFLNEERQSPV